ncbi:hypothetical protein EB796_007635 [Bugula neritina]|uniref:PXDN n=1 Tax=Bugula neritina TaxID=10212 RepID=A0A7J7K773_BUGNE|nr:hypothetical protein EB796_007635 [Bugula neritina]
MQTVAGITILSLFLQASQANIFLSFLHEISSNNNKPGRTWSLGTLGQAPTPACWIKPAPRCDPNSPYRTIDGSCNNLNNPTWGQSVRPIGRRLPPKYNPGSLTDIRTIGVTGRPLPSAREVSTGVLELATKRDLSTTLTGMHMTWGQFIDHDLTHVPLTPPMNCCNQPAGNRHEDCIPISVPPTDYFYGPRETTCLELRRSMAIKPGQCGNTFREQLNNLTSYIDAGLVYGNTDERAKQLRSFSRGQMTASDVRQHLPYDRPGTLCSIPPVAKDKRCFAAGDRRSNEWGGLTALHVLFLREHNRIAGKLYKQLKITKPGMAEIALDETVYQETRRIISALIQVINYGEYLPNVLGDYQMRKYGLYLEYGFPRGEKNMYDANLDATASNVFGTAAFRFGHSEIAFGTQPKNKWFHDSSRFVRFTELFNQPETYRQVRNDNLLRGMIVEPCLQTSKFSEEVKNRLFEKSFNGNGLDLTAVNMQRGREHGLPTYNSWRKFCGLNAVTFDYMPDHTDQQRRKFAQTYDHPDDIDLFPAAITERLVSSDAQVGPTFACLIGQEFQRLKRGDRFWFENQGTYPNHFTTNQIIQLSKIKLSRLICDNTNTNWLPKRVFELKSKLVKCKNLPTLNLNSWLKSY